jgi:hypothetical protein
MVQSVLLKAVGCSRTRLAISSGTESKPHPFRNIGDIRQFFLFYQILFKRPLRVREEILVVIALIRPERPS